MDAVGSRLIEFRKEFRDSGEPLRVSFRSLCSEWTWAKRSEVYTHLMHKYPAKILPYIPIFFLSTDSYASPTDCVFDSFAGTGTVLLESIVHPHFKRNALGVEISPLARLIAKVKTTPLDITRLRKEARDLAARIKSFSGDVEVPEFPNRDLWFPQRIQLELAKIRRCIEEVENPDFKDFFLVCLSSIIRDVSLADPKIAPPVVLKPENFSNNPDRQKQVEALLRKKKWARPFGYFRRSVSRNIKRVKLLSDVEEIVSKKVSSTIIWDDARQLKYGQLLAKGMIDKSDAKEVDNGSIGLVITSPPYINAQKYLRTTKFELFWLGLIGQDDVVDLDRQFVGTERVFQEEYQNATLLGVESADCLIEQIYTKDAEKAGVVSRYFRDMRQAVSEIYRVLKKTGRFVLVVGDNTICGLPVENHKILTDIATEVGFRLDVIFVDEIRSRGMITKRHETGGMVLDDWVIVLEKEG